ncbi:unnamed protein product [Parascedosporium putredinis]|uniref:Uncharacterized protein n=1 Tax=Parascedosporium putredinis TaxID=1442378 RepID=A0A9P1MA87_9PEZI|nr:unnamed protein product [Parascedosporium putredinis]CAI7992306.1 unnamed protein product [Parascedosporium putredinis]
MATPNTRARDFDAVATTASKTESYLAMAQFLTEIENRFRKEDRLKFFSILSSMGNVGSCGTGSKLKAAAKKMLGDDRALLERFDSFLGHAQAVGKQSGSSNNGASSSSTPSSSTAAAASDPSPAAPHSGADKSKGW